MCLPMWVTSLKCADDQNLCWSMSLGHIAVLQGLEDLSKFLPSGRWIDAEVPGISQHSSMLALSCALSWLPMAGNDASGRVEAASVARSTDPQALGVAARKMRACLRFLSFCGRTIPSWI